MELKTKVLLLDKTFETKYIVYSNEKMSLSTLYGFAKDGKVDRENLSKEYVSDGIKLEGEGFSIEEALIDLKKRLYMSVKEIVDANEKRKYSSQVYIYYEVNYSGEYILGCSLLNRMMNAFEIDY